MRRRIVQLIMIAAALALVFLLSRSGSKDGAPRAEPRHAAESRVDPPEPADSVDLAAPMPQPSREALSRREPAVDLSRLEQDVTQRSDSFAVGGRVVDDVGEPVTKFSIEAELLETDGSHPRHRERAKASFESQDGVFRLDALLAGPWQLIAKTSSDRRSAPVLVTVPDHAESVVLVLARPGSIAGTVLGNGRASVADARVYLLYAGEDAPNFSSDRVLASRARTQGSGRFLIKDIMPGSVHIMARHPDYADSDWIQVAVAPTELVDGVEIQLSQGGRIEGLIDSSLGSVADRQVGVVSLRGTIGSRETRTDAAGRFVLENVMPQSYIIELRPDGYGKPSFKYQPGIRKRISVDDGHTTRVVFGEAKRQITIHGTINMGGGPGAGLSTSAYSQSGENRGEESTSDPDGRFELKVAGPGEYTFYISASHGSYVRFARTVPDQNDVDLSFEVPTGIISGRVVGSDGQPLRRVPITAVRSGWTDKSGFNRDHFRRMYTEADGTFEFRLLASGSYTIRMPDGFQSDRPPPRVPYGRVVLTDLELDSSQLSEIEIRLPPECRISGNVVDALGTPVTDAWIRVINPRGLSLSAQWETQTDATGNFRIENVAPGTHRVRVWTSELEVTSVPFAVESGMTVSPRIEMR